MVLHNQGRINSPRDPYFHGSSPRSIWSVTHLLKAMISALWFLVTLPFRAVFWVIAWLGRLTAMILGFSLMVVGVALWASPLFFIGIPLFLVGLVLTLRCFD